MNNMRRGFTMIELIFVIVIIGILAAVAIPKLAATRDNATATTCVHEIGQLIGEISSMYTAVGAKVFDGTTNYDKTDAELVYTDITNLPMSEDKGLTTAEPLDWAYNCGGEEVLTIKIDGNTMTVSASADKVANGIVAEQVVHKISGSILEADGGDKVVNL